MSDKSIMPIVKLILSHHPDCPGFEGDTVRFFRHRVCLGCLILYPALALILLSDLVLHWDAYFADIVFHKGLLPVAAAIFFTPQLIKYFKNKQGRAFNVLIKLTLSLSIGFMIIWAFTLPLGIYLRVAVISFLFIIGSLSGIFRFLYIKRICSACKYRANWDICYGLRGLNNYPMPHDIRTQDDVIRGPAAEVAGEKL